MDAKKFDCFRKELKEPEKDLRSRYFLYLIDVNENPRTKWNCFRNLQEDTGGKNISPIKARQIDDFLTRVAFGAANLWKKIGVRFKIQTLKSQRTMFSVQMAIKSLRFQSLAQSQKNYKFRQKV